MSIFSTLGKVVKIVVDVVVKIVPLMDLIGSLIPSLQGEIDKLQHMVEEGGEVADNFVDDNAEQFETIKNFGAKLSEAGNSIETLMTMILDSANDDTITTEEVHQIYLAVQEMIENIQSAGEASKKASTAAKVLKNA